ncbi:protein kinase 4-like isoform X1 [Centruroides sculpturatus]|uniref:protein kinase 4-like isoform X1 n=1 Tax=Centruroides sculpturatus TaxID=218467 RepID=UPI000C6D0F8C|nr:protein kinase 4-like isoform X1 [Centruroides sculpturatus]
MYISTVSMQSSELCMTLIIAVNLLSTSVLGGEEAKSKRFSSLKNDKENIMNFYRVNDNTIIRTQDSRALGAKYLNETELPTNEDCLYWCYRVNRCNVAVYKEKANKSCYLFDCGSHNDFRCMFTQHTFYTSSILHANRHSHDLNQWSIQEKHENELSHLHLLSTNKPPEAIAPTNSQPTSHPAATNVTTKPTAAAAVKSQEVSNVVQDVQCRHYQFRCQNSSDCIAIYNVCDGIPQCPDGSDESSDLHCPNSGISKSDSYSNSKEQSKEVKQISTVVTESSKLAQPVQINGQASLHRTSEYEYPAQRQENMQWNDNYQLENAQDTPHFFNHKYSNFLAANSNKNSNNNNNNNNHGAYPNQWKDYYDVYNGNVPQQLNYQDYTNSYQNANRRYPKGHVSNNNHYNSYQDNGYYLTHMESLPSYNENVRDDSDADIQSKSPGFMESQMYQQQNQWTDQNPQYQSNQGYNNNMLPYIVKNQGSYNTLPKSKLPMQAHNYQSKSSSNGERDENFQSVQPQYPLHNDVYQQNNPTLYQPMIEIPSHSSPPPPPISYHETVSTVSSNNQDLMKSDKNQDVNKNSYIHTIKHQSSNRKIDIPHVGMSSAELQESIHKHSEESNSAMLALTVGLCVTALLLVLVGCRMRSIRRRLARRKRSALVHDADYLVNGMYL